uniref:Glucose-6-phosphate isomerase n=1 Tax=Hanusia phi TaxID=3032 RepID=A5XB32_9CRYP|nr:cytosolic glucose-6-phosphate isomerase [Hanusia phi]
MQRLLLLLLPAAAAAAIPTTSPGLMRLKGGSSMPTWSDNPAVIKLREIAKNPYDLSAKDAISPARINMMQASACGLKLLYATERVDEATVDALSNLAKERDVFGKMKAMMDGEVINKIESYESENRKVLHTAMRDVFDKRNEAPAAKEASDLEMTELSKLKDWCNKLDKEKTFTDLILIGIGGSDLGPRALYLALQGYKKDNRRVHFVSNVDPDDAAMVLKSIPDLSKTLVLVCSKSGGTLETLTNEQLVRDYFVKKGLDPKKHFACVTGKGSPMDNPAEYLISFYMFDYIGGRYSATSMVGGPMLAFGLGYQNYEMILKGAHDMDRNAIGEKDVRKNLPLLLALLGVWNRNFLGHQTLAVLPYSQALVRFTAHLQQLDMESNGKHIDREGRFVDYATGPIIWGEPGTNGQHSFYQLIHQGTDVVPCEFVGFTNSQFGMDLDVKGTTSQQKLNSNLLAQSLAMAQGHITSNPNKCFDGNRPNCVILGKKLDPYTLGALLALYEHKVAFQGFLWDINSFDQEGVQLGKVLANQFLDIYQKVNKGEAVPATDNLSALVQQMP